MGWNNLSIPKPQRCNCCSLEMNKLFHPTLYQAWTYLSMLGLKLKHVSKRGHWSSRFQWVNREQYDSNDNKSFIVINLHPNSHQFKPSKATKRTEDIKQQILSKGRNVRLSVQHWNGTPVQHERKKNVVSQQIVNWGWRTNFVPCHYHIRLFLKKYKSITQFCFVWRNIKIVTVVIGNT